MKSEDMASLVGKAFVSLLVGAIYAPCLIWLWAQVARHGLIFDPLYASGLRGGPLLAAIFVADFFSSLIMLLPIAVVLRSLGLSRIVFHTALAVGALFIASFVIVGLPLWPTSWQIFFGNISPYAALCADVWLLSIFGGHTSNNSSKSECGSCYQDTERAF